MRIRYVTQVTAENLDCCLYLTKFVKLRHLDDVQESFAISETKLVAGIRIKKMLAKPVCSNVMEIVERKQDPFETLRKSTNLIHKCIMSGQAVSSSMSNLRGEITQNSQNDHDSLPRLYYSGTHV